MFESGKCTGTLKINLLKNRWGSWLALFHNQSSLALSPKIWHIYLEMKHLFTDCWLFWFNIKTNCMYFLFNDQKKHCLANCLAILKQYRSLKGEADHLLLPWASGGTDASKAMSVANGQLPLYDDHRLCYKYQGNDRASSLDWEWHIVIS